MYIPYPPRPPDWKRCDGWMLMGCFLAKESPTACDMMNACPGSVVAGPCLVVPQEVSQYLNQYNFSLNTYEGE